MGRFIAVATWGFGVVVATAVAAMYVAARAWTLAPGSLLAHAAFALRLVAEVGFLSAGAVIVSKRPHHVLGWVMLAGGLLALAADAARRYARVGIRFDRHSTPYEEVIELPARMWAGWFGSWASVFAVALLLVFVPLVFPSGRLPSRRWVPVASCCAVAAVALAARVAFAPGPLRSVPTIEPHLNPFGANWALWLQYRVSLFGRSPWTRSNTLELPSLGLFAAVVIAAGAVAARYARTPPSERTPVRWFAASALLVGVAHAATLGRFAAGLDDGSSQRVLIMAASIGYLGMAVSTLVAIFRHRLFELDLVVRRTAAFGGLSVFISLVYVTTTLAAGWLAPGSGTGRWLLSVVGTTAAAAGLEPVRQRAERMATRVVFGDRLAPFELATQLSHRLAQVAPPEAPAALARQLGTGIGAQRVVVRVGAARRASGEWRDESAVGQQGPTESVAVDFRGEVVAELEWARASGDLVTASDRTLVGAVAAQAAPALHSAAVWAELADRASEAARRSADLDASRRRLAAAQLEAQAQFQADLHDVVSRGLGRLADDLRAVDAGNAPEGALSAAKFTAESALRELRRLGRGLYPGLLEERGLAAALRGLAEETPAVVDVVATPLTAQLDPAAASALLFTCVDIVRGLARSDQASLRLEEVDGSLVLIATVPAMTAAVREAVEDRVEAVGGVVAVDDSGGAVVVRVTLPAGGGEPPLR